MESTARPTDDHTRRSRIDSSDRRVPHADLVSLEAVVSLLVKKGIVTVEELYDAEEKLRLESHKSAHSPVIPVPSESHSESRQHESGPKGRHRSHSWLKRKMSRRRWTRRLGTALFGWEWKKVKRERKKPPAFDLSGMED